MERIFVWLKITTTPLAPRTHFTSKSVTILKLFCGRQPHTHTHTHATFPLVGSWLSQNRKFVQGKKKGCKQWQNTNNNNFVKFSDRKQANC